MQKGGRKAALLMIAKKFICMSISGLASPPLNCNVTVSVTLVTNTVTC